MLLGCGFHHWRRPPLGYISLGRRRDVLSLASAAKRLPELVVFLGWVLLFSFFRPPSIQRRHLLLALLGEPLIPFCDIFGEFFLTRR